MPTPVIVPIRSFHDSKQRLSDSLQPAQRALLTRRLADHVTAAVVEGGGRPLVVTSDVEVRDWAKAGNLLTEVDPGAGLDAAAQNGVERALADGSDWVVLHGDLPWLTGEDVRHLLEPMQSGSSVIAPSTDGGTSAIGSRDRFDFSYGPGSFHRHIARLADPNVVVRRGLLLDIDTPADFIASKLRVETPAP